jgi:GNAT superfamily N-acetyltransferase
VACSGRATDNKPVVRVKERRAADLAVLAAVLPRVHEADGYPMWWPVEPGHWLARKTDSGAWVAQVDQRLVGHVGLHAVKRDRCRPAWTSVAGRAPEDLVEVVRLFIAPEFRRQGIARRLLDSAVEYARARGKWPVLDVVADDRPAAEDLYRVAGWRFAGTDVWFSENGRQLAVHCWVAA